MKATLITLLMLLMSTSLFAQSRGQQKSSQTVYYVVVGSFESLQEARNYNNNGPFDVVCGSIYKATVNGKTVYRVCAGVFNSKAKAQKKVKEVNWIYTSQ